MKNGIDKIVRNTLDELYTNPMTGAINEGYMQHIAAKYGITAYAESYIKKFKGMNIIIGQDIVEEWVKTYGKSLTKILLDHDAQRV